MAVQRLHEPGEGGHQRIAGPRISRIHIRRETGDNPLMATHRNRSPDPDERRRDLDRRLRLAFLEGAEQRSRDALGRGLTDDELRRIVRRFPAETPR